MGGPEAGHGLHMVRLREGIPHTQVHQVISVLREDRGVASQRHWIAGDNDDNSGSKPANRRYYLRTGTCSRWVEDYSMGIGSPFATEPALNVTAVP